MKEFFLCFLPLFVAVDVPGVLPIFMGLIEGVDRQKVHRIIWQSVFTATAVAMAFLALGKFILSILGITIADFMVAGGALLFVISLGDLLMLKRQFVVEPEGLGAVPIGVPLIVGPAVLTTMILLLNEYGPIPTVTATVANVLLAGFIFYLHEPINRLLGRTGIRVISKLASIILASIGVMMVRKGIMAF